jgi:lipopolysaccharide transport system ATP-binding protein
MHSETVISAKNLAKVYRVFAHPGDRIKQALAFGRVHFHRQVTALKDISFEIKKGETIGIIGRNGSGKSTLLQLICGVLKPTAGRMQVNGRISALLELGSGFSPEFTGRENVYFQGAIMGFTEAQMDARFEAIAAFADIGESIDQEVRTYSSGMYVRLAFAVAIHVEPDILVIDEALGVGDALFSQKCFRFLNEFRKTGTLIVVSHDLRAINGLCERVIWLDQGTLRAFGPVKDVCQDYLSALFGGAQRGTEALGSSDDGDWVDQRMPYLNASNLRNDLKLYRFNPASSSFGRGGAQITDVRMTDPSGQPYSWVVGGEPVILSIQARVNVALESPIIGFTVKDDLGQALFGDNTYVSYADNPVRVEAGGLLEASFHFRMPRLRIGDYSVAVAVAEGSQATHELQHWVHDALVFQSTRGSVGGEFIGLPMRHVSLTVSHLPGQGAPNGWE